MDIREFRQRYPQYDDLSDQELADRLYQKHYSDLPREEFDRKFLGTTPPASARGTQEPFGAVKQFLGARSRPPALGANEVFVGPGERVTVEPGQLVDPRLFGRRQRGPSLLRRGMTAVGETMAPAALPMLGAAGGGAVGGVPGAVGGAMLGEAANQAIGLKRPSVRDVITEGALTAAFPVAGRAARGFMRGAARFLPGAHAALRQEAAEQLGSNLNRVVAGLKPLAQAAFKELDELDAVIPAPKLGNTLSRIAGQEARAGAIADPKVKAIVEDLQDRLAKGGGSLPFQDIKAVTENLSERIRNAVKTGESVGALKAIRKALFDAVEEAGEHDAFIQDLNRYWTRARETHRSVRGFERAATLMARKTTPVPGGKEELNVQAFLKALRTDPTFQRTLPEDVRLLERAVEDFNLLPPEWQRWLIGRGLPIGLGLYSGGLTGAAVGLGVEETISRLLQTGPGRRLLVRVLRGELPAEALTGLGVAGAGSGVLLNDAMTPQDRAGGQQ